jgi:hypothetical protein
VNADAMQESIRNARDEVRLDVRNETGGSWSYRGSNENIAAYLERLQTQRRVSDVTPEGNGVYSMRGSDGALHWFFPAGRDAPVTLDVVGESVEAAAPDVPAAQRSQAIVHLRGAGWSNLGSFAGGLPRGSGGPLIAWLAHPEVGGVIANNGLPMPVVRELSQSTPEQLDPITRGDPRPLPEWYRAWRAANPDRPARDFIAALDDLAAWRGTLDVSGPFQATTLLGRRAEAEAPAELEFTPTGPAVGALGSPMPLFSDVVTRALRGETVAGAHYLHRMRYDAHFVIEIVDGHVARMFEIGRDGTIVRRVPVATLMTTLRGILIDVSGAHDDASARAELARSDPILLELDALLDFRSGVPVGQIHLMEALASHPLRSTAPVLGPPDPAAVPAASPAARPRRRIVVASGVAGAPPRSAGPQIDLADAPGITRRPGESEGDFVDRVVRGEERAYQESINGPAGRRGENPERWARVQPRLGRLVSAMRNMQARLRSAGRGQLLPEVNDEVLSQPVDMFVSGNPALRQMRFEILARLRANAERSGGSMFDTPEGRALQPYLNLVDRAGGASVTMDQLQPDIVEFLLGEGNIHITDVTTQLLSGESVHAFKTRVYVEIMRQIVGHDGPQVSGQDIEMHTDTSGQRIDPARTRFGDIIE